jgi:hypothetical protein
LIEPEGYKSLIDISLYDPRWRERRDHEPSKNHHPVVKAVATAWSVSAREVEVWSGEATIATDGYYGVDFPVNAQTLKLKSVDFE